MVVVRIAAACSLAACSFHASAPSDGRTDGVVDARVDGAPGSAKLKVITIDSSKIAGAVQGFPMWFVVDDSDLAAHATTGGVDIYFTKTDGTTLAFERGRWVKATGHLEAWIKLDLDPSVTNAIELRYGDPGPAAAPDPPAVFANGFLSVWHFEDALLTSAVVDTVGNEPGTASGFGSAQQVAAQLGGGFQFDGLTTQVAFTNTLAGGSSHTISAWVKMPSVGSQGFASIVTLGDPMMDHARFFYALYNSGLGFGFFGDDAKNGTNIADGMFHLVHWVYDANVTTSILYHDAQVFGSHMATGTVATAGNGGLVGSSPLQFTPGGNTSNAIAATLDEVRIATVARTAQWIRTELNNQSQPTTFYTVGPERLAP